MKKRLIPILILFLTFVFSCSTTESIAPHLDSSNVSEDISTIEPVVVAVDDNSNIEMPPNNIDNNVNEEIEETEEIAAEEEPVPTVQEEIQEAKVEEQEQVPLEEEPVEKIEESIVDEGIVEDTTPIITEESTTAPSTTPSNIEETKKELPIAKQAEPAVSVISSHDFPTPVLNKEIGPNILQLISVIIVITVVFTISIAIRGANKMQLPKGLSIAFALLFTLLAMLVSTLVSGWSYIWLAYLILLLTYFVFRARWRSSTFA